MAKLSELQRLGERLKLLSAHDAFFLLKNCFSLPKLAYTLRCAPYYQSKLLSQYDDVMRNTLENVLNIQLSDTMTWAQAVLPVASGGLGVRLASDVALPAFLSSVVGSVSLLRQILPERLHDSVGTDDAQGRYIPCCSVRVAGQMCDTAIWTTDERHCTKGVGRTFGEGFRQEVVVCCAQSGRACLPSCGSIISS